MKGRRTAERETGKTVPRKRRRRLGKLLIFDSFDAADRHEREYWWAQTPAARLRELERLRRYNFEYGEGRPLPRFQRVLEVAELGKS